MYLITNAIKNLARNKGRNILLATVILAIIIGVVVTLTIYNAASRVIDEIRLDIGSRVTIELDILELFRSGMGIEEITANAEHIPINDFIRFADSEYLSNAILNAEIMFLENENLTPAQRIDPAGDKRDVPNRLLGTSEPDEALADIIVEGRMFNGLNEAIIDDEFARLNDISVGDIIELETSFSTIRDIIGLDISDKIFELTVVGIYSADIHYEEQIFVFTDIFTSFDTIAAAGWESNLGLNMSVEYFLRNPNYLELFENEVRAMGLPDTYAVFINQAAYDRVSGPMLSMNSAVMTFSIVILILGSLVLALISFLVVRERKYEVGVLRAMGMERGKVAFGILTEAIIITTLCLIVGLGAGIGVAQPIANNLLESRVVAADARAEELQHDIGGSAVVFAGQMQTEHSIGYRPESEITVGLSGSVIIQVIIITLGLAALSGTIGVVVITRYEPLKILRERS